MASQPRLTAGEIKPLGLRSREFAKFRSPRDGEVTVAVENDGNASYPASVNATASGETEVLEAPGVDKCLRIKTLYVNNKGTAQRLVSLTPGASAGSRFTNSMPPLGAVWNFNLIGAYWILPPNTAFLVNLDNTGDVNVQVGYDIVKAIPTKELTDALIMAESLVTVKA